MSFLVCKISAGLHICNRLISMYYNNTIIVRSYGHSDKVLQYSATHALSLVLCGAKKSNRTFDSTNSSTVTK